MRPRGLQLEAPEELQGVDEAFGDVTISFGGLGGLGTSPLSLLSPNSAPLQRRASPARTAKAAAGPAAAVAAAASFTPAAAAAPPSPSLPEENDPLGDLPQFGQRGGGGAAARRKPDARRQSLAIGAMFAGLTQHAEGLLGDSELAVGDEEVQVPLAKSGKLLGGAANHSSLFVDPDTADLLATQLPSPQLLSPGLLGGPGALAGADGQATPTPPPRHLAAAVAAAEAAAAAGLPAAEQPTECDSPRVALALRALAASARKTPGGALFLAGQTLLSMRLTSACSVCWAPFCLPAQLPSHLSEEHGPSLLPQACARAWRCSATSHVRVRAWAWMTTMTTTSSCRSVAAACDNMGGVHPMTALRVVPKPSMCLHCGLPSLSHPEGVAVCLFVARHHILPPIVAFAGEQQGQGAGHAVQGVCHSPLRSTGRGAARGQPEGQR